jgi:hypothetical protein
MIFSLASSSSCSAQGAVGDRSAATRRANSAASTSRSRSASSFLRLTYRWPDSATPIRSQIRRWLTTKCFHSQCASSRRSTSSTRFFQSPLSACPCPGSDPPPASLTARSHPPAVAASAPRPRLSPRTSPSTHTPYASTLPTPVLPPPRFSPPPSALALRSSPLRYTSSSTSLLFLRTPQNAKIIYPCARILGSRSAAPGGGRTRHPRMGAVERRAALVVNHREIKDLEKLRRSGAL